MTSHSEKASEARALRAYLSSSKEEGEDLFFLMECLSFLVLDTEAAKLSSYARHPRNKFLIRKLKSALELIESTF